MNTESLPTYWEYISTDDQKMYEKLAIALAAPSMKNKRNKKVEDFEDIVSAINLFIHQRTDGYRERALVVGLYKLDGAIAVNIEQLKKLVHRCKSSINGCLKGMEFGTLGSNEWTDLLVQEIPQLSQNMLELRKWNIRVHSSLCNESMKSSVPSSPAFESPAPESIEFQQDFGLKFEETNAIEYSEPSPIDWFEFSEITGFEEPFFAENDGFFM